MSLTGATHQSFKKDKKKKKKKKKKKEKENCMYKENPARIYFDQDHVLKIIFSWKWLFFLEKDGFHTDIPENDFLPESCQKMIFSEEAGLPTS